MISFTKLCKSWFFGIALRDKPGYFYNNFREYSSGVGFTGCMKTWLLQRTFNRIFICNVQNWNVADIFYISNVKISIHINYTYRTYIQGRRGWCEIRFAFLFKNYSALNPPPPQKKKKLFRNWLYGTTRKVSHLTSTNLWTAENYMVLFGKTTWTILDRKLCKAVQRQLIWNQNSYQVQTDINFKMRKLISGVNSYQARTDIKLISNKLRLIIDPNLIFNNWASIFFQ